MQTKQVFFTSATQLSSTLTMLLRNVIFANLLSPNDYGLAMTFGVVLIFFEHLGNFGHDNFILRSSKGDELSFQSTLHTTLLIRGLVISFLIFILAPVIPLIFGLEETRFNYAFLAIIPFLNAFAHLDYQRLKRQFNYSLTAKITISADFFSIFLALTLVTLLPNYWAFLISLITRQLVFIGLSHLLSIRPYRLSLNYDHLKELLGFGLPILTISLLKYFSIEADKVIIVRYLGLLEFTSYILTILVIKQSISLSTNAYTHIFIRRISQHSNREDQHQAHKTNAIALMFITCPLLLFLCIAGEQIITFVFSSKFQTIAFLVPIVCLLFSFRVIAYWLNQIVIASDKTSKMLMCSVFRLAGFILALIVAIGEQPIVIITVGFILGELIYILSLVFLLKERRKELPKLTLGIAVIVLLSNAVGWLCYYLLLDATGLIKLIIAISTFIILILLFLIRFEVCRRQLTVILSFLKKA